MASPTGMESNSGPTPAANTRTPPAWARWGCLSSLVVLIVLGLVLYPAVDKAREAARRSECRGDFFFLRFALQNYHETYGCFPPPYIADAEGRPMHSWRVLILPFIDQAQLYNEYRFDEPWDGPNNRALAGRINRYAFHCASDVPAWGEPEPLTANFLAVVGPEMAWQEGKCMKLDDITDDHESTIMLVEVANSGVHWMEPRDLHVLQMAPTINAKGGQGISSRHVGGAHAATAGGRTLFLSEKLSAATIRALLTIHGRERISEGDF